MMTLNIRNAKDYIQRFLKIKTKENKIVPLTLNEPQLKLYNVIKELSKQNKPIRIIILKARQMGFSTLTESIIFHRTATKENVNSLIIAHKDEATNNLFNMSKLFYESLPPIIQPMKKASNAKELIFENPTKNPREKLKRPGLRSKIKCATAGGDGVGRSDTLTNVHASEYAFWPGDPKSTFGGLSQSVPDLPGTMIIIESTANGFNDFKKQWDRAVKGESDYVPVFFAWFEMQEYRKPYDGFELTKEEEQLKETFHLDNEQLAWRRWCIENNCSGDINLFKQEYPATPEEAFVSTGSCIFDKEKVSLRIAQIKDKKPLKQGYFVFDTYYNDDFNEVLIRDESIRWVDDREGPIKIFKDKLKGVPYVLSGDTAGEGSDNFVGHVIDNVTNEQVAILKHKNDEDYYAKQMYCLGKYYNYALIGIEVNFTTYPIKELQRLGYHRQFYRESTDSITARMQRKYGFRTDKVTRPVILATLVQFVSDHVDLINDVDTLREMLTFVRNDKGRAEAMEGEHDDCVMALAIYFGIAHQQSSAITTENEHDEEDDYDDQVQGFLNYGG